MATIKSIEEKAKAYDNMFERLKEMYNSNKTNVAARLVYERYFPELKEKESEDERIRKSLIDMLKNDEKCYLKEIAWLEEQGQHKKFRDSIQVGDKVTRNKDGVLVNLSQLKRVAKKDEKQGGQKSAEWSEKDEDTLHCIIDALDSLDIRTNTNGEHEDHTEEIYWLKSIKDRVQIKPQQEWSEEDETALGDALWCCKQAASIAKDENDMGNIWFAENWLKSLKDRVQLQNGYNPYREVVESIAEMCKHYDKASHSGLRDFYDNVKVKCKDAKEYESLFPQSQWKPSDEQMVTLEYYMHTLVCNSYKETLFSLYQDLKKLREE